METILKIADIALYGAGLFTVFYTFIVYGNKMNAFLADVFRDYPISRYNSVVVSVILLLAVSLLAQILFFFPALILWVFLLFGAPFLIFQVKKKRHFDIMMSTTVAITICYGIVLFFFVDNVRDIIGHSFIPQYSVYYQTETVSVDYHDLGYIDKEADIAHIHTGNDHFDYLLSRIFPTTYRITVFILYVLAMFLFINIKNSYYAKQLGYRYSIKPQKQSFKEVMFGEQIWMADNLNVERFRNGDPIPFAITDSEWRKSRLQAKPAWCFYDHDPANGKKYGKLYNWYAINDPRGLAPEGWHIPSDDEWTQLINYVVSQGFLNEEATPNDADNHYGFDDFGFLALLGGCRRSDEMFSFVGSYGYWWSSTEDSSISAWCRCINKYNGTVDRQYRLKGEGFSVCCSRDVDNY